VTTKTRVAVAPTTAWRNRISGAGEEAPDQLLANPANWRIHPKAQQDALAGALDQVGWVAQVLVNRRSGFVVDGHARVALALTRGEATVPVLYVDLEPDEEALVLATLDPIGAMATRDEEKLRALLAEVTVDDAGLRRLLADMAGPKTAWGSETQIRSRGGAVVLVDESTEQVQPANIARADRDRDRNPGFGQRWGQGEGAMRAPAVIVLGVGPKRSIEMPPTSG
jgi:hypothetical protein